MTSVTPCPAEFTDALLAQTGWLRALVRSLVRDAGRVDDVCQATLLEAWRLRPRHDRCLRPWLARVARSLVIGFDRRERTRPLREARARRRDRPPTPAEVLEQVTWHQSVVHAVLDLPEPYRHTILLRFWEDADPRTISRRTGVPLETVRTRLKRGLAQLRHRLDREAGGRSAWVAALAPLAVGGRPEPLWTLVLIMTTKKLLLTAAAVLAAATLAYVNWPAAGDGTPAAAGTPVEAAAPSARSAAAPEKLRRVTLATTATSPTSNPADLDPGVAAALCGLRGRIVRGSDEPVADCPVRVFRFGADSYFAPGGDVLEPLGQAPRLPWQQTVTDREGRFLLHGIHPRGSMVLLAGRPESGGTLQLIDRSPAPGEVVDLGDIDIGQRAVVTGTVVDDDGRPVAAALVRGTDLPGAFFQALPLADFDPDGALINRDPRLPIDLVRLPPSVRELYRHLPIPCTHTDATGRFRLNGLTAGNNVLLVTRPGYLATVKPRIKLATDASRDIGTLRLRTGESIRGRVLDTDGAPVVGAEVAAAATSALLPLDLARFLAPTDAEGRFHGAGFPSGRVTVAVRRGPGSPWTVVPPQSSDDDWAVRLPAVADLELHVVSKTGRGLAGLSVELLKGRLDADLIAMRRMGFTRPIELAGRLAAQAPSHWRVRDLEHGRYVAVVAAADHAAHFQEIDFGPTRRLDVTLEQAAVFHLRVTDETGRPVPQARVFGRPADRTLLTAVSHVHCGTTDQAGRLEIRKIRSDRALVAVSHPAYGMAEAVIEAGDRETQVILQRPGSIAGRVLQGDRAPQAGEWVVMLIGRPAHGENILRDTPRFAPVTAGGRFGFASLQPGRYELRAMASAGMTGSLRGLVAFAQGVDDLPSDARTVTIEAATVATPTLVVGSTAAVDPAAHLTGSVTVDGASAVGMRVRLADTGGERLAETVVDSQGRFDLGPAPAGSCLLRIYPQPTTAGRRALYNRMFEPRRHTGAPLEITIHTTTVAGTARGADGRPAAGAEVVMRREIDDHAGFLQFQDKTGADGTFRFTAVPTGRYTIQAHRDGTPPTFAPRQPLQLAPGRTATGLILALRPTLQLAGRVDLEALRLTEATGLTLHFLREQRISERSTLLADGPRVPVARDGSFRHRGFAAGTYRVELRADPDRRLRHQGKLVVEDRDQDGLELRRFSSVRR